MSGRPPLSLFAAYGVELEYMIVQRDTLAISPIADLILEKLTGQLGLGDFEDGAIGWSNELVNHVLEMKTNGPAASLTGLAEQFHRSLIRVQEVLGSFNACLMPTAMHPWMHPATETKLWPHENSEVYAAFDRIFNCQGHGWSNLQSTHINLPFADDAEFAKLHAAIRLILPLLPALAASSPFVEGQTTGILDNRLHFYQGNCARIPSITAAVIPEPVYSRSDYEQHIFQRMFDDIAPHDPEGILREEWLNARGAIARFTRHAIEIRVLDIQECPKADVALVSLVVAVIKALVEEHWSSWDDQQRIPTNDLKKLFDGTIRMGDQAQLEHAAYLRLFGVEGDAIEAQELWQYLASVVDLTDDGTIATLLNRGCLARTLVKKVKNDPKRLTAVYRDLCDCLRANSLFV